MTSRPTIWVAAAVALLLWTQAGAAAHDVWLDWRPAAGDEVRPGDRVDVRLLISDGDAAPESVARNDRLVDRFVAVAPDGRELAVPGLHGVDPAGVVRPDAAGAWSLVYVGRPVEHRMDAEAFDAYLEDEGLDQAQARRRRQSFRQPGRELFSRSLEARLWVGEGGTTPTGSSSGTDAFAGGTQPPVRFELRRDGCDGAERAVLTLLADGEPVPGALVDLRRAGEPPTSWRTDATGGVARRLDPGRWVATAVVMEPLDADPRADWRTIFAALTFDWPEAAEAASEAPGCGR